MSVFNGINGEDRGYSSRKLGAHRQGQLLQQRNEHQAAQDKGTVGQSPTYQANPVVPGESAGRSYSEAQTPAATPCSADGGVWVTISAREVRGSGCTRVSSTTGGEEIAGASGSRKRKRKRSVPFSLRCTHCIKKAKEGQVRKRLSQNLLMWWMGALRRVRRVNNQVRYKCCKHHEEINPPCACYDCRRAIGQAVLLLGQGAPDSTYMGMDEVLECTRENEMDVTDREAGGIGEEVLGATPTAITPRVVRKPVTTVFILSSNSADSATVSVCTENAGNRVVSWVNKANNDRSCSREACQQLSHAANGRRQVGDDGVPSSIEATCKHAVAALYFLDHKTAQWATPISWAVNEVPAAASTEGLISAYRQRVSKNQNKADEVEDVAKKNGSFCGDSLMPLKAIRGRLLGQGPEFVHVEVTPGFCDSCEVVAWASDNWRLTQVFNYINHLLVDLGLLSSCREAFIRGIPITRFFDSVLVQLRYKQGWAARRRQLAKSLEKKTIFLNLLEDVCLAFEALTDHQFE